MHPASPTSSISLASTSPECSPNETLILRQLTNAKREAKLRREEVDDLNRVIEYFRVELSEKKKEIKVMKDEQQELTEEVARLKKE